MLIMINVDQTVKPVHPGRMSAPTATEPMPTPAATAGPVEGRPLEVPRGLKGVVVASTTVGDVRGKEGFYHYREHSAIELAEQRPIEDVCRLMLDGELPRTTAERAAFVGELRAVRAVPAAVAAVLPTIAAVSEPLDGLRTALSLVGAARGMRPLLDLDPAERRADALALCAVTPVLLCALHRLRQGLEPVAPRDDLGDAADLLWMLHGAAPDPEHARAMEQYLVSTVDHGFNASTFSARVVASTGADLAACIVAAVGALSGPLHGGAPSRVLALLDEIGSPERIAEVVRPMIRRGERIMGFGHAVYRTEDPRTAMLRRVARRLASDGPGRQFIELAEATETTVERLLDEHRPGRGLRANVELYAGVVMRLCGVPAEMFTPAFASSRVIGWCANVLEQAQDDRIIRPSARYVGPAAPEPVPTII
jgi:citrate synthase